MDRGPDDDRDRFDDERGEPPSAPVEAILRGGAAALALDLAFSLGAQFARPAIRHPGFAAALVYVVYASKLFSGYVGGRVASRAGVAHDDRDALRTMALGVTALTMAASVIVDRLAPWVRVARSAGPQWSGPPPGVRLVHFVFEVVLLSFLLVFGFAMGTWAQARRDDKVQDEEPSADD
ncbi:MAG: hypothetical protein JNK05_21495 [Myxococcales bacterium]|nr:hypothetical protein [Myxococcales bacterium]